MDYPVCDSSSVLVIVPTYDEVLTIEAQVARLRCAVPEAYVLIVDDNSPDGTGQLAESLARGDDHIQVVHRPAKGGLGTAYVTGLMCTSALSHVGSPKNG